MTQLERRNFLKLAAGSALALGLNPARALAQASVADQVLFFIFLRGAQDGVSVLHPEPGTAARRTRYQSWRGVETRIANGIPVGGGLAMHPALAPLSPLLSAGHLSFVPGIGGAVENRSHFQMMDLVESGAGNSAPLADGVLGRALGQLVSDEEPLGALALSANVPYVLRRTGAPPPLSVPNLEGFGALSSPTHRSHADLQVRERISRLYVPASGVCGPQAKMCQTGLQAVGALTDLRTLIDDAAVTGQLANDIAGLLAADSDRRIRMLSLDIGGWDTHNNQGNDAQSGGAFTGTLAKNLAGVAGLLRALHDAAVSQGVFSRLTTLVMTEFGRTTFQNGTQGTDHGYGSVGLVMSEDVRARVTPTGWFPASLSAPFYATAESTRALPRLIEHRQVFAEVLRKKFGLTDLSTALPGYTYDTTAPAIFG